MFAVVVRTGVVVVVFERHVLCAFGGQVSEARVECTFLANDAAYLTLSRAVTQLRRSEIVTPGVGLTVCVVCGVSNESVGFGRAFSLQSQSECIMMLPLDLDPTAEHLGAIVRCDAILQRRWRSGCSLPARCHALVRGESRAVWNNIEFIWAVRS